MGVPTSEVSYTPVMPRREDYEVHKGHVVALGEKKNLAYISHIWRNRFHGTKSFFRCQFFVSAGQQIPLILL